MLEIRGLCLGYGATDVVHEVTLTVGDGEAVALLGRNGAGKTTTLRGIAGQIAPSSGEVVFAGENLNGSRPSARVTRGIALVPEGRCIFKHLTVRENLLVGSYCRNLNRRAAAAALERVLEVFPPLRDFQQRRAGLLSGGEQQMLAIGRALMSSPRLMLLDEPSLGLSPIATEGLYRSLKVLLERDRLGVLLVEQYVDSARRLCEREYTLEKGRLTASRDDQPEPANYGLARSDFSRAGDRDNRQWR